MSNQINPSATVAETASMGANNIIGANVVIEDDVVLGDNNVIMSGAILKPGLCMGNDNVVHEYAVLSGLPQDIVFDQSMKTLTQIGNGNVFREYVTVHRASQADASTIIGDNNYFMTQVHIAHDCEIDKHVVIAPGTGLGGFVTIEEKAFISGGVMVHQFVHIGAFAMIGGNAKITRDVLPYMMVDGNPASVSGLNKVGLRRAGFKMPDLKILKQAYQLLFRSEASMEDKTRQLSQLEHPLTRHLVEFMGQSNRSFHRDKS